MRGRRILLVACRTAAHPRVRDEILFRHAGGPCHVTLLVPTVPPSSGWTWDEAHVRRDAHRRMTAAMAELRRSGVDVRGVVGDFRPMQAIRDEIDRFPYDEMIISTLPAGISRWLRQDLPARAARAFAIPVTHIVAEALDDGSHRAWVDPAA
jgi:hypothetical protein